MKSSGIACEVCDALGSVQQKNVQSSVFALEPLLLPSMCMSAVLSSRKGSVLTLVLVTAADCSTFRVDTAVIKQRVPILLKYLDSDTEKELQALYALQASIVKLDQPASKFPSWYSESSQSGRICKP